MATRSLMCPDAMQRDDREGSTGLWQMQERVRGWVWREDQGAYPWCWCGAGGGQWCAGTRGCASSSAGGSCQDRRLLAAAVCWPSAQPGRSDTSIVNSCLLHNLHALLKHMKAHGMTDDESGDLPLAQSDATQQKKAL